MTTETFKALVALREAIGILADRIPQSDFESKQARRSLNKKLDDLRESMGQYHVSEE